jgi:fermentation-respiration switch protein FrsA (DUF1100 family)
LPPPILSRPLRIATTLTAAAALVYAGLCLIAYVFQSHFLYHPRARLIATPAAVGLSYDNVEFTTSDGYRLHGWYLPDHGARGTLLFVHGNGGNISYYLQSLRVFHGLHMNVLIFDYRGYGGNRGTPSEQGTYRDVEAAWRYLTKTRAIPPSRIAVDGRSLGGAIAAYLANRHTPAALILESTFQSIPSMIHHMAPWLPARLIARYHYDTRKRLARIHCPILIVHSKNDEVVPFSEGRALFAAANPPKEFLELHGSHDHGFLTSGKIYRRTVSRFLEKYLHS